MRELYEFIIEKFSNQKKWRISENEFRKFQKTTHTQIQPYLNDLVEKEILRPEIVYECSNCPMGGILREIDNELVCENCDFRVEKVLVDSGEEFVETEIDYLKGEKYIHILNL